MKLFFHLLEVPPNPVASRSVSFVSTAPPLGLVPKLNFLLNLPVLFPLVVCPLKILRQIISHTIRRKICLMTESTPAVLHPAVVKLLVPGIVPAGGISLTGIKFRTVFRIIFDIVQQIQHIIMIMNTGNNTNAGWKSI